MTSRIVKLPDIGEGVAEAEVTAWYVKVGDMVREDQLLADVMTDKATVEIPSPVHGRVVALGIEAGRMLAVGAELVRLVVDGTQDDASSVEPGADAGSGAGSGGPGGTEPEPDSPSTDSAPIPRPVEAPSAVRSSEAATSRGGTAPQQSESAGQLAKSTHGGARPLGEKPIASPAVRRRALEAGIDLRRVRGKGPAGRITHDDLDAFAQDGGEAPVQTAARAPNLDVAEIKVIGLRRRISQKMADAKRRAAHFSYVEEVDVTAMEDLRTALNRRFGEQRLKLTLIPFLVQALIRTLPDFPQMNAHYDDEGEVLRCYGGVHVGIATQTPSGLMVPVLRHAEIRDLWSVASEVKRLAEAARTGLARREELSGSSITITSLGSLGGIVTTPVLNLPEVAIIGVNKQVMRPLWRDGAFVPRLTMNLSASFDHRVVDGSDAARFVQAIKDLLETPALLVMEA